MPDLEKLLNEKAKLYNQPGFIKNDPICIPHLFTRKQDIEIAGLFASILAWGNRTTIINSCKKIMQLMHHQPYEFILNHSKNDLKKCAGFVHRTFNDTDLLYFIHFLHHHYKKEKSLETAFSKWLKPEDKNIEPALEGFFSYFFSLPHFPLRTQKHIATPAKNSACKRLNMYLRWMVRRDKAGVDFGIWKKIDPAQLIIPLDVHTSRTARKLGLLQRRQNDWKSAVELTENLKQYNAGDPVLYDFALFGLSAVEKF